MRCQCQYAFFSYLLASDNNQVLTRTFEVKEETMVRGAALRKALLLLHNHTKGKEERIFTYYEEGKQIWW